MSDGLKSQATTFQHSARSLVSDLLSLSFEADYYLDKMLGWNWALLVIGSLTRIKE